MNGRLLSSGCRLLATNLRTVLSFNHRKTSQLSQQYTQIIVNNDNGVRTITLSSPKTRNALSMIMLQELENAINIGSDCNDIRCFVINAIGEVFSAGHNLKEMVTATGRSHHQAVLDLCSRIMMTLPMLPIPVIAQVNGVAAAAGCQLVASCDIVVASEKSSFMTPGANVGIFCSTPGIPLVRCVPRKVAAHMLLTGLPISAEEALRAGLVSKVVPEAKLVLETKKITDAIVGKSQSVMSLGKRFMYSQLEMGIEEAYREGSCVMVDNINMSDGQEGICSFVEKRKPKWSHKEN